MKSETFEQMLQDKLLHKRLLKIDEDMSFEGAIVGVEVVDCYGIVGVELTIDKTNGVTISRVVPFDQNCMIVTA